VHTKMLYDSITYRCSPEWRITYPNSYRDLERTAFQVTWSAPPIHDAGAFTSHLGPCTLGPYAPHAFLKLRDIYIHTHTHICVCVYMYVYMYIHLCVYIYIYIYLVKTSPKTRLESVRKFWVLNTIFSIRTRNPTK